LRRQQASPATIALAFAILGSLVLGVAPASARLAHEFGSSFAGSGTNALSAPRAVAVDNSAGPSAGDVYVTDSTTHRVEKFDAAGNFILMFGRNVNATTPGDVCPVNPGDVCQPGTAGTGAGQFNNPAYIAIDDSTGPSSGDVYVAEGGIVQKFDSGGYLITSWGGTPAPGQLDRPTVVPDIFDPNFSGVRGIVVDQGGNLVVGGGGPYSFLFHFDQAGHELDQTKTARPVFGGGFSSDPFGNLYVSQSSGYTKMTAGGVELGQVNSTGTGVGLASDPGNGDLFVSNGTTINAYHFTGSTEVLTTPVPCSFAGAKESGTGCPPTESFGSALNLTNASGLAVSATSGAVYAANPGGGNVVVFTPYQLPDVIPAPESNLTKTSATINQEVDPAGGSPITACHYEYGSEVGSYLLGSGPCSPDPAASAPTSNFSEPTLVSADLTGLDLLVPYHYRFVVTTAKGTVYGQDQIVRSVPDLPKVTSTSASAVTDESAVIKAEIDPGEGLTSYRFDYGPTTSYELHTLADGPIDPESSDHTAVAALSNLEPGTTYHFRVAATNFTGTTFGPDTTFTTPSAPIVASPSATGVGRTSATLNAVINPGLVLTTYHFEYGTGAAYTARSPESAPIGPDSVNHAVSASIENLNPATTYHFRIVAANAVGTTAGIEQSFTTGPPEETKPEEPQKPCKRGFVRKHGKCVRKPRHHRKHHRHG
jgi:hypothetical protein